jgi:hypothetical protein
MVHSSPVPVPYRDRSALLPNVQHLDVARGPEVAGIFFGIIQCKIPSSAYTVLLHGTAVASN